MEAGLLLAALCIVALTTLMLGNEIHWARSESWMRSSLGACTGTERNLYIYIPKYDQAAAIL